MNKKDFIKKITILLRDIKAQKPDDLLDSLNQFTDCYTLETLLTCLSSEDAGSQDALRLLLAQLTAKRTNTCLCLMDNLDNPVNQLLFSLAQELSPPITTDAEIDTLGDKQGPYFILYPKLAHSCDIAGLNIHHYPLGQFILTDDQCAIIPIGPTLEFFFTSDQFLMRHTGFLNEYHATLSANEVGRLINHSSLASLIYRKIRRYHDECINNGLAAKLTELSIALRRGGVHQEGEEFNSGISANQGIVNFKEYWDSLSADEQTSIFAEEPDLKNILGRLFRPDDDSYKGINYCVEVLAQHIDPIVDRSNKKQLGLLQGEIRALFDKLSLGHQFCFNHVWDLPQGILHLIHNLPVQEQAVIFQHTPYKDALHYALFQAPHALGDFTLEPTQQVALCHLKNHDDQTPLLCAASHAAGSIIQQLIDWGSDLNAQDRNRFSALHYAAEFNNYEAVKVLLIAGANCNAMDANQENPLFYAVNNRPIVELLLRHGALISKATLHEATSSIDLLCLEMITYDLEQQQELTQGYLNVLFYAADKHTHILAALVDKTLSLPSFATQRSLLNAVGSRGINLLMIASIRKNVETVRKLLSCNLGGGINAIDNKGITALHFAVFNKSQGCVNLLLQHKARIMRDHSGHNPVDIALNYFPQTLELFALHLIGLSAEEQRECIAEAGTVRHPNVLFFAAQYVPEVLPRLLDKYIRESIGFPIIREFLNQVNADQKNILQVALDNRLHDAVIKLLDIIDPTEIKLASLKFLILHDDLELLKHFIAVKPNAELLCYVALHLPEFFAEFIGLISKNATHLANLNVHDCDRSLINICRQYHQVKENAQRVPQYYQHTTALRSLLVSCLKSRVTLFANAKLSEFIAGCRNAIAVFNRDLPAGKVGFFSQPFRLNNLGKELESALNALQQQVSPLMTIHPFW